MRQILQSRLRWLGAVAIALACLAGWTPAAAQDSGRLLATSGVTQFEGAGGGGLTPWALITGYGTRDAVGANAHYNYIYLPSFQIHSTGASAGFYDRLELSYDHVWFDTGATGGRLGLGRGYQFEMDVAGAKLRLFGHAVYDQSSWVPQVAAGLQFKAASDHATLRAIGARSADGVDAYVAATKLFLAQSLLVNATIRATEANQFGLLGFGGDRHSGYRFEFEGSAALLLARNIALGAEVRTKPDNLRFAHEGPAFDVFGSYFLNKHLSATLAFLSLGPIANQGGQNGAYISVQAGF